MKLQYLAFLKSHPHQLHKKKKKISSSSSPLPVGKKKKKMIMMNPGPPAVKVLLNEWRSGGPRTRNVHARALYLCPGYSWSLQHIYRWSLAVRKISAPTRSPNLYYFNHVVTIYFLSITFRLYLLGGMSISRNIIY
jgi:hypothetical protein